MAEVTLRNPVPLQYISQADSTKVDVQRLIVRSRPAFFVLCVYILVNCYMIPILQIGPSWAVWPSLADIVLVFFSLSILIPNHPRSKDSRSMLIAIIFIVLFLVFSYLVQTIWFPMAKIREQTDTRGIVFGVFQVYRVLQLGFIYYTVSYIPMTPTRLRILRYVVMITLILICSGIIATYFEIVETETFASHITDNVNVGGPWTKFYKHYRGEDGLGTIGYNHSYPSTLIVLMTAFYVFLLHGKGSWGTLLLLGLGLVATFLTGSRSGFVAYLVWMAGFTLFRPQYMMAIIIIGMLGTMLVLTDVISSSIFSGQAIERQSSLTDPFNSDSLSGRPTLWSDHLNILSQDPFRLLVGHGFGSTMETGHYSHQNYLQIVIEMGLVGLIIGAIVAVNILVRLYKAEPGAKPLFWATVGILISATNDEMFYPVPHRGHFLNMYVLVLALVLGGIWYSRRQNSETMNKPARWDIETS